MSASSDHDKIHDMIIFELREVKKDVKALLALKYQVLGMSTTASIIVAVAWQLFLK